MENNKDEIPLSEIYRIYEQKTYNTRTKYDNKTKTTNDYSFEVLNIESSEENVIKDKKTKKKQQKEKRSSTPIDVINKSSTKQTTVEINTFNEINCIQLSKLFLLNKSLKNSCFYSRVVLFNLVNKPTQFKFGFCTENTNENEIEIMNMINDKEKYNISNIQKCFIVEFISCFKDHPEKGINIYLNNFVSKEFKSNNELNMLVLNLQHISDMYIISESLFVKYDNSLLDYMRIETRDSYELSKSLDFIITDNSCEKIKHILLDINKHTTIFYRNYSFEEYDSSSNAECKEALIQLYPNSKIELYLILKSITEYSMFFVKSYSNGGYQWVVNPHMIKINNLIGEATKYSIRSFSSHVNFYIYLEFSNTNNNSNSTLKPFIFDKQLFAKKSDCKKCTYKIEQIDFVYCVCCFTFYHSECYDSNKLSDINPNQIICDKCKICPLCFLNENPINHLKIECRVCNDFYHYDCLNSIFLSTLPENATSYWKCDKCLECKSCKTNMNNIYQLNQSKLSNQEQLIYVNTQLGQFHWSNDYDYCSNCSKRYTKKEFCPICNKLWNTKDCSMIECKGCKMLVHKDCDRLKRSEYNCPKCRIKVKNLKIKDILLELKQLDAHNLFTSIESLKNDQSYKRVIKKPIGFNNIEDKINESAYLENWTEFESDFKLICSNAQTYNKPNDEIYKISVTLQKEGEKILSEHSQSLMHLSLEYLLLDKKIDYSKETQLDDEIITKFSSYVNLLNMKKISKYFVSNEINKTIFSKTFKMFNNTNQELDNDHELTLKEEVVDNVKDIDQNDQRKRKKRKPNKDLYNQAEIYNSNYDLSTIGSKQLTQSNNLYNSSFSSYINKNSKSMTITETHSANTLTNIYSRNDFYNQVENDVEKDNYLYLFYPSKIIQQNLIDENALFDYFSSLDNTYYQIKSIYNRKNKEKKKEVEPVTPTFINKKRQLEEKDLNEDKTIKHIKEEESTTNTQLNKCSNDFNQYSIFNSIRSTFDLPIRIILTNSDLIFEDNCFLCGSFNDSENMITCKDCLEKFHLYCGNQINIKTKYPWIELNSNKTKENNLCKRCVKCYFCNNNSSMDCMLQCFECNRSFHGFCLPKQLKIKDNVNEIKCPDCFKCQSCNGKDYYKNNFPLDINKDYTLFMRMFSYCIECGFDKFYTSKCDKCLQSFYNDLSKQYIQIKDKTDFLQFKEIFIKADKRSINHINKNAEDLFIIMVNCNVCEAWYHSDCISLDFITLDAYFQSFEKFTCLDCHCVNKEKLECLIYSESIKKAFKLLSFSKIINQLLLFITKSSSMKLHTKLIQSYTKQNFNLFLNDKDFLLILELVRLDSLKNNDESSLFNENYETIRSISVSIEKERVIEQPVDVNKKTFANGKFNILEIKESLEKNPKKKYEISINQNYLDSILLNNFLSENNQFNEDSPFRLYYNICSKTYNDADYLFYSSISTEYSINPLNYISNTDSDIKFENDVNTHSNIREKSRKIRLRLIKNKKLNFEKYLKLEIRHNASKAFQNPLSFYNFDINKYLSEVDNGTNYEFISKKLMETNKYFKSIENNKAIFKKYRKFVAGLIVKVITKLRLNLFNWLIEFHVDRIKDGKNIKDFEETGKEDNLMSLDNRNEIKIVDKELQLETEDPLLNTLSLSSLSKLKCEICHRFNGRKESGRLIPLLKNTWIHYNCLYWSKGIAYNAESFSISNVLNLLYKSKYWKCDFCKKYNATIQCSGLKCNKYYHYACGFVSKCTIDSYNRTLYCSKSCLGSQDITEYENNTNKRIFVIENYLLYNDVNPIQKRIPCHVSNAYTRIGNTTIIKYNINSFISFIRLFEFGNTKFCLSYIRTVNNTLFGLIDSFLSERNISFFAYSSLENIGLNELKELNAIFNNELLLLNNNSEKSKEAIKEYLISKHNDFSKLINTKEKNFICKLFSLDLPYSIAFENPELFNNYILVDENIKLIKADIPTSIPTSIPTNIPQVNTSNKKANPISNLISSKESKKKIIILNNFVNNMTLINNHNKLFTCFPFFNYVENNQQMKQSKKHLAEENTISNFTDDKKKSKVVEKALLSVLTTNNDLPLAIKYLNYKKDRVKVTIGPSYIHRNGLFALCDFNPGEIVIEYVGEIISNKIADYREKEYNLRGFGDCYMFRIDNISIIDASQFGNLARFINHSCDPNCYAESKIIKQNKHIFLYAKKYIKANEEITYDYNFECEEEKIQCRCGSSNCQGRLN